MNIKRAQIEVLKIKKQTDVSGYQYRSVTPDTVNYRTAIFQVLASLILIVIVLGSLYFFI